MIAVNAREKRRPSKEELVKKKPGPAGSAGPGPGLIKSQDA